jgi:hypothetical protein
MSRRLLPSSTALGLLPVLAALSLGACSSASDDPGAGPGGGEGGATLADGAPAPSAEGGGGPVGEGGSPALGAVRFTIQVDYRFDKAGFFADPVRKQALEGACRIWGRLLADDFPAVPKGTFIKVRDPEKPNDPALALTIDYAIEDLVIFVGSSDLPPGITGVSSPTAGLSGIADGALAAALQQRFDAAPFQPWTAWISFDSKTDFHFDPTPELGAAVPAGKLDFVSVALHEIGHTLGFGTAGAFTSKIVGGAFTGSKTVALFGGPLPLTSDLGHVPNTTMSGGHRMLMDLSDGTGTRYLPTPLDQAVLEDLGLHF